MKLLTTLVAGALFMTASMVSAAEPLKVGDTAPDFTMKGSDGKRSGRVVINRVTSSGTFVFVEDFVPSTHDGNDDFGWALAVQQRPYSDSITDEGGRETYIGIGMPGAKVDGVRAGNVYVWRPWNSDGSLHTSAHVIEAYNPQASTDTRFGASIATLRPLKDEGGFVAGAPEAITTEDDVDRFVADLGRLLAGERKRDAAAPRTGRKL